jgi:ASCH domain
MRCLKIEDKWVNLILNGTKTSEIRRRNTKIRERIAFGNTKIKRCVGYARIVDSVEELKKYNDKHQANDFLEKYAKGRKTLFAWILENVEIEAKPNPYSHSTGSWSKIKI